MSFLGKVKRVLIQLPNNLLQEVDGYLQDYSGDRNEFIKEATKLYLREKKRQQIREKLRHGYIEMSEINLKLADEGLSHDAKTICYYEDSLAECE